MSNSPAVALSQNTRTPGSDDHTHYPCLLLTTSLMRSETVDAELPNLNLGGSLEKTGLAWLLLFANVVWLDRLACSFFFIAVG